MTKDEFLESRKQHTIKTGKCPQYVVVTARDLEDIRNWAGMQHLDTFRLLGRKILGCVLLTELGDKFYFL